MVRTPSFHSRELRFHPRSHGMAKNLVNRFNQFGAADHFCQRSFNLIRKSDIYCNIYWSLCEANVLHRVITES